MLGPVEHPWFDPLWRRVLLVLFCGAWTLMEFSLGNTTWVYIIGAITAYAAYSFLYAYNVTEDGSENGTSGSSKHARANDDGDGDGD